MCYSHFLVFPFATISKSARVSVKDCQSFTVRVAVVRLNMGGTFTVSLLFAAEAGCITNQSAEEALCCAVASDIIAGSIALETIENAINIVPPASVENDQMEQET